MWPRASFLCSRLSDVADDRELYKANNSKSKPLFLFLFSSLQTGIRIWCFPNIYTLCIIIMFVCVLTEHISSLVHIGVSANRNITHRLTGTIFECRVAYFQTYALQPFLSLCPSESQSEQWISDGLTAKQTGLPLDWCLDCNRPPWSPGDREHVLTERWRLRF